MTAREKPAVDRPSSNLVPGWYWTVSDADLCDSIWICEDGEPIAEMADGPETYAKARLMAAAPALRMALRRLLAMVDPDSIAEHTATCRCATHEALAALARAEGRQP